MRLNPILTTRTYALTALSLSNFVRTIANGNCVSFESRNYPGYYLRHENARIKLRRGENTSLFRDTATFCPRAGLANSGATSFESFNYPGHYIRHYNSELWVVRQANDNVYRQDATFQATAPWVP